MFKQRLKWDFFKFKVAKKRIPRRRLRNRTQVRSPGRVDLGQIGEVQLLGAVQIVEGAVDVAALYVGLGDEEVNAGALLGGAELDLAPPWLSLRTSASSSRARAYSVMARSTSLKPIQASPG